MIIDRLKKYIVTELLQSDIELDDDTLLIKSGTLTSLQAVSLVQFIETEFGVEIEPEEISEHQFRSPRSVAELVERKLEGQRQEVA